VTASRVNSWAVELASHLTWIRFTVWKNCMPDLIPSNKWPYLLTLAKSIAHSLIICRESHSKQIYKNKKTKKNPTPYKRVLPEESLMLRPLWDQLQEKMWKLRAAKTYPSQSRIIMPIPICPFCAFIAAS
jgi:hypothetical protein